MGSEKDYEIAYRCMAYSTAMLPVLVILSIIPYLSPIVRAIWTALLMIIASIEVHSLKALTAKIVFGIIGAISLFFGVSSEYAARNIQDMLNNTASNIENSDFFKNLENLDNLEDMTPEEAGEKVGEFLKGLEEGSK